MKPYMKEYVAVAVAGIMCVLTGCKTGSSTPVVSAGTVVDNSGEYVGELVEVPEGMIDSGALYFARDGLYYHFNRFYKDKSDCTELSLTVYDPENHIFQKTNFEITPEDLGVDFEKDSLEIFAAAPYMQNQYIVAVRILHNKKELDFLVQLDDNCQVVRTQNIMFSSDSFCRNTWGQIFVGDEQGNVIYGNENLNIVVLDAQWQEQFTLKCPFPNARKQGTTLCFGYQEGQIYAVYHYARVIRQENYHCMLEIDIDNACFGDSQYISPYGQITEKLPLTETEDYYCYWGDWSGLFQYSVGDTFVTKIYDSEKLGADLVNVRDPIVLDDEVFLYPVTKQSGSIVNTDYMALIHKQNESGRTRTPIVCAVTSQTGMSYHMLLAIREFNETNTEYYIEVQDYREEGSREQLVEEMRKGKIPDIIETNGMDMEELTESGIFADLTKLAEQLEISEELWAELETNGTIYEISVGTTMTIGNQSIVSAGSTWALGRDSVFAEEFNGLWATIYEMEE